MLRPKSMYKSKKEVEQELNNMDKVPHVLPENTESFTPPEERGVSSERLDNATRVVQEQFNLTDGYAVTAFKDKGDNLSISLSNSDFEVTVVIKDTVKYEI